MTVSTELNAKSTMREVLDAFPGAQRVLKQRYHIGGCQRCGYEPGDHLGDVLASRNIYAVDEVIESIKTQHEQEQRLRISPQKLAEALKSSNPPKLIDTRHPQEQDLARIDGALPATQDLVQEAVQTWPKETPIVMVCHHGMTSMDAAMYFAQNGFTNVHSLDGGIDAWSAQIDPTVPRY